MRLPAGWWPRSQRHHNSTEDPPVTLALGDRGGWPSSVSFLMAVTITPMLASARKAMQIFRKNKLRRPSATVTSDQSPSRTVSRSPDQDFYIWETPSRWIAWPGNLARDCLSASLTRGSISLSWAAATPCFCMGCRNARGGHSAVAIGGEPGESIRLKAVYARCRPMLPTHVIP